MNTPLACHEFYTLECCVESMPGQIRSSHTVDLSDSYEVVSMTWLLQQILS